MRLVIFLYNTSILHLKFHHPYPVLSSFSLAKHLPSQLCNPSNAIALEWRYCIVMEEWGSSRKTLSLPLAYMINMTSIGNQGRDAVLPLVLLVASSSGSTTAYERNWRIQHSRCDDWLTGLLDRWIDVITNGGTVSVRYSREITPSYDPLSSSGSCNWHWILTLWHLIDYDVIVGDIMTSFHLMRSILPGKSNKRVSWV